MKLLLACASLLVALPAALAGSQASPEVRDGAGDGGAAALDITAAWVNGTDARNLTFHLVVPGLPTLPVDGGACSASNCVALALGFRVEFAVLRPDGEPAPTLGDYNRTYAVYRHGAVGVLHASVGYYDDAGALTFTGEAVASVGEGGEIVLRIPREAAPVNLPTGAEPGPYRIASLRAHSAPEVCAPPPPPPAPAPLDAPCTAPQRPTPSQANPAASVEHWDVAPDAGFGADYVFPSPAAPPPATLTTSTTPPPARTPSAGPPTTTTAPPASGATTTTVSTTAPAPATPSTRPTTFSFETGTAPPKQAPALGVALLAAGVAVAVAVRRRLA